MPLTAFPNKIPNKMLALDVLNCPLTGSSLIEASAGSGKTWNICALYIRLLIESKLTPDRILVITFTNAATAELRERIRQRIASLIFSLQQWMHSKEKFSSDDILFNHLIQRYTKEKVMSIVSERNPENQPHSNYYSPQLNSEDDTDTSEPSFENSFLNNEELKNSNDFSSISQILACLRYALNAFDQAAILTIHGFSQRVLSDVMLIGPEAEKIELVADDIVLREELAVEFWRRKIEPIAASIPGFMAWLAQHNATPIYLAEILKLRLKQPLSDLIDERYEQLMINRSDQNNSFNKVIRITEGENNQLISVSQTAAPKINPNNKILFKLSLMATNEIQECLDMYQEAAKSWFKFALEIKMLIKSRQSTLHAGIYKAITLEKTHAAWHRYLTGDDCWQFTPLFLAKPELYSQVYLSNKLKKGQAIISHPFFELVDQFLDKLKSVDDIYRQLWLSINRYWLDSAPEKLDDHKNKNLKLTFDDLLRRFYLKIKQNSQLAQVLCKQYPAALVDEFQDTDPLQYAILNIIYPKNIENNCTDLSTIDPLVKKQNAFRFEIENNQNENKLKNFKNINLANQHSHLNSYTLFLVGDPKQAIYSFRAADIHSYLQARDRANFCYTLSKNWRSTPSLINACNRLFIHNPLVFIESGLDFFPAQQADLNKNKLFSTAETHHPLKQTKPFAPSSNASKKNNEVDGYSSCASQDLQIWLLPDGHHGKEILDHDAAINAAGIAIADEIARLLNDGLGDHFSLDPFNQADQKSNSDQLDIKDRFNKYIDNAASLNSGKNNCWVRARDIAVLVRTHQQAAAIKQLLDKRNVGSVIANQLSVFQTADADICYRVLIAIEAPADLTAVKSALSSDWFNLSAMALLKITENVEALAWVDIFLGLRSRWHLYGFSSMWNTLLNQLSVLQRISRLPNAECRLNHICHLGEKLQQQSINYINGIGQLSRWLALQKFECVTEANQVGLESDQDLVQIMTIHKAKGLEFPIIFLPCLFDICPQATSKKSSPLLSLYSFRITNHFVQCLADSCQSAQNIIIQAIMAKKLLNEFIDDPSSFSPESFHEILNNQALIDEAAEAIRLIYVSLTRAARRCYLVAGAFSKGGTQRSRVITNTALNWLSNTNSENWSDWQKAPPDITDIYQFWFSMQGPEIAVSFLPEPRNIIYLNHDENNFNQQLSFFPRRLLPSWQINSFSQIIASNHSVYNHTDLVTPDIKYNSNIFEFSIDDEGHNQFEERLNEERLSAVEINKLKIIETADKNNTVTFNDVNFYEKLINQNKSIQFTDFFENQPGADIQKNIKNLLIRNPSETYLISDCQNNFNTKGKLLSINCLPKGIATGILLHRIYDCALKQPIAKWCNIIERIFEEFHSQWRGLVASKNEFESWQQVLTINPATLFNLIRCHLNQVMTIQLPSHLKNLKEPVFEQTTIGLNLFSSFCLANIPVQQTYSELNFTWRYQPKLNLIKITNNNLPAIKAIVELCQKYDYGLPKNINLLQLNLGLMEGFIQGEIDWVFCYQNKYYFIDWKSNDCKDADSLSQLNTIMVQSGYWLQALIYTLALHRQLRLVMQSYCYETNLGGFYYIFVRNLDCDVNMVCDEIQLETNGLPKGVIGSKPPFALINALDQLFS